MLALGLPSINTDDSETELHKVERFHSLLFPLNIRGRLNPKAASFQIEIDAHVLQRTMSPMNAEETN